MLKKTGSTSHLFDLPLFSSGKKRLLESLKNDVFSGKIPQIIYTPNPEQLIQTREFPQLLTYFSKADYLVPDGTGLVLATKLLSMRGKSQPVQEKIAGVDLVGDLLAWAQDESWRVLIIGGRDYGLGETVEYAGQTLWWTPGYKDVKHPTTIEEQELENFIVKTKPDFIFVAFGAPWQEQWIAEHELLLKKHRVKIAMVVGGSFDYLLGKVRRAPSIVRALGLEWLFRLVKQPWRWRRQLRLVTFIKLTLIEFFS
jgi:N-acetylglucosaminyldiphosphoundecaprenol N-acetyl-beta-D-mannosaminyltransferase